MIVIICCAAVTVVPRILPFIFSKKMNFPKKLNDFLSFLPMCILTALFFSGLFEQKVGQFAQFNVQNVLASIPTLLVAFRTKNLVLTVLVGLATMAMIRAFL